MDLTELADDELDQHRREVLVEQERRQTLATIPDQVRSLADTYRAGGGEVADLHDALDTAE